MKRTTAAALFSKSRKELLSTSRKIRRAAEIFLFLDYDGTLTPIRRTPGEATLAAATQQLLRRLSALSDVTVAIVTGRSMRDIRRLVPLDTLVFAANHGLHIRSGRDAEWIHMSALAAMPVLKKAGGILRRAIHDFPGAFVENKQLTLSIHFRNCAPSRIPALKNVVTDIVCSIDPTLRITKGKKVLEIRPDTDWGKSHAVLELLKASDPAVPPLPVYIGDDTTDEEAFRALRTRGIGVHVGTSATTAAHYYVRDVEEALGFLQLLYILRGEPQP